MLTSGPRVLIVEDAPIVGEVASAILRTAGYRVDVVLDGLSAVEAVRREAYDVVLMDCQLPGIDGYEATRRIRGLEASGAFVVRPYAARRRLQILAFTAHATDDERQRARAAGMDNAISKPIDARELIEIVDQCVAVQRADESASRNPDASPDGGAARPR